MVFEKILTFIHILRCTASILFMLLGACRLYKNLSFFYMIEAKNASIILKKTFWIIVCLSLATCLSIGLAFSESDPSESSNWDKVVGSILFTGTMVLWIYYGCYLTEIILRGLGSASAENDDNFGFSNPDLKQPTPAKEEIKKPQEKIPKEKEDQKPLVNEEGIGQDQQSVDGNEINNVIESLISKIEKDEIEQLISSLITQIENKSKEEIKNPQIEKNEEKTSSSEKIDSVQNDSSELFKADYIIKDTSGATIPFEPIVASIPEKMSDQKYEEWNVSNIEHSVVTQGLKYKDFVICPTVKQPDPNNPLH